MSVKVLIAFYSRSGSTEALARAVADGAEREGAEVRLRRAREFVGPEVMAQAPGWQEGADRMNALYKAPTADDADWADAIVFGTPTRFGSSASELKAFIDGLGGLAYQGKLNGKVGSAFVSTQSTHGGNEGTILSMYAPMAHLGLIIVPTGYGDPVMMRAGTPYGASSVSGAGAMPTEDDLEVARFQGKRLTLAAKALRG
jgi:NAD(P)H dehydrogenase (quinone)